MIFEKIYIIGSGSIALNTAKSVKNVTDNVGFISSRSDSVMNSPSFFKSNSIEYLEFDKEQITDFFGDLKTKTLIVSASNRYIFPNEVISQPNLTIINYHGALLPKFPGRNAEAWTIFEESKEGGITWHKVVAEIDAGEILIQKKFQIDESLTSFSLLREYSKMSLSAFEEILTSLVEGTCTSIVQDKSRKQQLYYSWQKPNNGYLDMSWSGQKTSAFLRSMDYGPFCTLGKPKLVIFDKQYDITKYRIERMEENGNTLDCDLQNNKILMIKDSYRITLNIENNEDI